MANSSRKSPVVPPEVRELIEESQKIQGWVDRLAEHESEARPEVYRRVLSDYQGRLGKVTGRLVKHRADLVSNLQGHEADVASLKAERDTHSAELEEVRLRHVVGEYSDEDWEERRGGIEGSIGRLDERLAVEEEAVAELSEIISSIAEGGTPAVDEGPPAATAAERAPAPAGAVSRDAPAAAAGRAESEEAVTAKAAKGREAAAAATATPAPAEGVKARAPKKSDAPKETTSAPRPAPASKEAAGKGAAPPAEPAAATGREDDDAGDYLDELEFLESLSLDEAERFDAVSAMLDEDESGNGKKES